MSLLRNPEQIPCLVLATPVQSQVKATDDEDTPSMRELVKAINIHVESVDLKITSNFNAPGNKGTQQPPTKDVPYQPANDVVQFFPTDPAAQRFLIILFLLRLFSLPFIIRFAQSPGCGDRTFNLIYAFLILILSFIFLCSLGYDDEIV